MRSNPQAVDCLLVACRKTRRGGVPELLALQDQDGSDKRASDAPFDDLHQVLKKGVAHVRLRMSTHLVWAHSRHFQSQQYV